MFARVSTIQSPMDKIDEGLQVLKSEIAPRVKAIEGGRGVIGLVDRETGKSLAITFWESAEAMRASEEEANQLRSKAAGASSGDIAGVDRYEVSIFDINDA